MSTHMDEKDWIITRLLRLLLETGQHSSHSDVIKTIDWLQQRSLGLKKETGEDLPPLSAHSFLLGLIDRLRADEEPKPLPKHWRKSEWRP